MTTSAAETQPPSSRARVRSRALGALLLLAIVGAAAGFGGVVPESRAFVHVVLTIALLLAASLPDRALARAGGLLPVATGLGALGFAVLVGLVPVPRAVLQLLAPDTASAHAGRSWHTLSLLPERTVDDLAFFVLLLGVGLLAATWATFRGRRSTVERVCLALCATLVAVAGAHHLAATSELFGVFPTSLGPRGFFAPFVDRNHFGAALVLGLPVVVGVIGRERAGSGVWLTGLLTTAAGLWLMVVSGSRGAAVGLMVAMGLLAWRRGAAARALAAVVALGAAVVLFVGSFRSAAGLSLDARPLAWSAALDGLPGAWFAGNGGGTVAAVVDRHRLDGTGYVWGHLHNDPLEWLVETGLVGLLALGVAVVALAPRPSKDPRAAWWTLGLVALGVNSLVEFPLQMPSIAMAAVALLVCRRLVFEERRPASPGRIRALLLGVALLQPIGAAWNVRTGVAERASHEAWAWHDDHARGRQGADVLRRVAPWRVEIVLVDGWEAAAAGDWDEVARIAARIRVAYPHDPDALRPAAALAAKAGQLDEAREILERAEQMAPRDWQTAIARARLAAPEDALDRWREAFVDGAPPKYLEEAYRALPIGLVWVDAMADAPGHRQAALARVLARRGETDAALLAWERARMLDDRGAPTTAHIAALVKAGRFDEAERLGREALEERPDDPALLERLGDVHLARGDTEAAVDLFMRAGEVRPAARAHALRAVAAEGGTEAATAFVRRLELVGVQAPELRLELAEIYAEQGEPRACLRQVDLAERDASGRLDGQLRHMRERCDRKR